jgi:hypothetical protein
MKRQAAWQKQRSQLSWPEKIRMAEAIRESVGRLRRQSSTLEQSQLHSPADRNAELPLD